MKDVAQGTEAYEDIGYDELVTYAVYQLQEKSEEPTFERIVAECFELFPARFHLHGYPQWPDAARINKSWLRCRTDKGLIVGRVKEGFRLTAKGTRVARLIEARLQRGTRYPQRRHKRKREGTKEHGLVSQLESSAAFKAFQESGSVDELSEYDFRDALVCTMDTPSSVLNANIQQFADAAHSVERRDIIDFLHELKAKFAAVLGSNGEGSGGMMRRRRRRR